MCIWLYAEFTFLSPNSIKRNGLVLIVLRWEPPALGWFRLNVDGSYLGPNSHIAAVDVIRNDSGHWVNGIAQFCGPSYLNSANASFWILRDSDLRVLELEKRRAHVLDAEFRLESMFREAFGGDNTLQLWLLIRSRGRFLRLFLCRQRMQQDQRKKSSTEMEFFSEYGDANRYKIQEVIGKGSYGVVCSAIDSHTGEKVAIKKIHDIFEHISDAARILREIKLLRLLRHPDIVEIKHIMLPSSRKDFKDIYVVFECMESDLHQVIKANDDLTKEHHQFFLYQLLRALKYIHTANVYHRDLKPKNILANANCKLKICDFGLARVAFSDTPATIFWTDYVATRWYRAPELCGSFYSKLILICLVLAISAVFHILKKFFVWVEYVSLFSFNYRMYTPAIDIWSIGCIFAEVLTGKPLFPGKNVVHQLDLMTDLLGTPSLDTISRVRNDKARRYLTSMRKKQPVPFAQKFPNADPLGLSLLERLLAFDPKDRPNAEEALAHPYFKGLAKFDREPSCQPISKMEFEFERRRVTKEEIRELIFREILEYHPQLLKDYMNGIEKTNFLYPSAVEHFRKQFANLEENGGKNGPVMPPERKHVSLPRSTVVHSNIALQKEQSNITSCKTRQTTEECGNSLDTEISVPRTMQGPQRMPLAKPDKVVGPVAPYEYESVTKDPYDPRSYIRGSVPPSQAVPPAYYYQRSSSGYQESSASAEAAKVVTFQAKHAQQCGVNAKVAPDIAISIDTNPFFMTRAGVNKIDQDDQIAIDTNLLQPKAHYGAISSAAAGTTSHRKVGSVQYGMAPMF
ncbi:Mitogen-activated protein kinase 10 [Senna tora]|uniref:mitogen-activated protein kinase n=1 Tax=Senna tora TaxID=362788 RepID=A0A834WW28_9FABA|nr:Mitogen-activated protein kinase 10 [Senna tora]